VADVFICKCGASAECHPDLAGHLQHIECPECHLATPAIDTATMEGAAKLISTWEWLGGAVEYPQPVTAKESLAVRGLYAVFADNGNVICFSQLRSHASLLKLEAEGRRVVTLVAMESQAELALAKLHEVAKGCYDIASSYSGSIDGVEEHGGDDHEDPVCAIHHRLYYALFDSERALKVTTGVAEQKAESVSEEPQPTGYDQELEQFAIVPVARSYDMRAAAITHFNTARQGRADLDDALDAAWRAMLAKAHQPAYRAQQEVKP